MSNAPREDELQAEGLEQPTGNRMLLLGMSLQVFGLFLAIIQMARSEGK